MGEIVVDVGLENARDRGLFEAGHLQETDIRRTRVRAVADTGAVMLALPEDVVGRLGAQEVGRVACTDADGRRGERPIAGPLSVHIGNRWTYARCVVIPSPSLPRSPTFLSKSAGSAPVGDGNLLILKDRGLETLNVVP